MNRIYLDYAATTPLDSAARRAMDPFYGKVFGNPSSLHSFGQEASRAVFVSRKSIVDYVGVRYDEVIFTGSATEANNMVMQGAVRAFRHNHENNKGPVRAIISAIEHDSILKALQNFPEVEMVIIPVDSAGMIDVQALEQALNENTAIVSVGYVNGEVGTIQNIAAIGKRIAAFRGAKRFPLFHTDAVQALQYLNMEVKNLGVDAMTLSAHKVYGPKGIGALVLRHPDSNSITANIINPLISGGDQEFGMRPGTENVAAIVGFASAVDILRKIQSKEIKRMQKLGKVFFTSLSKALPGIELNGPLFGNDRISNNINVYLRDLAGPLQNFLVRLDRAGVAASSGSACASRKAEASHVLRALYRDKERREKSVRFTLGKMTTGEEVLRAVKIIKNIHTT
ncbi:MAG: cysteine desulfurase family protein [Patescibacteria group bacterium]